MLRYGSIYIVTNTVTGEQYVGQTRQIAARRWKSHINTANSKAAPKYRLARAIIKHGPEAFKFSEVFSACNPEALNDVEIALIGELSPAYNTTRGGSGHRGVIPSAEVCKGRSERLKRQWADPAWRAKQVAKLAEISKTPEAKERGRKLSALRLAMLLNRAPKKKPRKKDRSECIRKSWEIPEVRTARILGLKKALQNPDVVARRREAALGRQMKVSSVEKSARAKWKPVYCQELQCSFLSQKAAADFLGVLRTSVTNAVKHKGRVAGKYTLEKVA